MHMCMCMCMCMCMYAAARITRPALLDCQAESRMRATPGFQPRYGMPMAMMATAKYVVVVVVVK